MPPEQAAAEGVGLSDDQESILDHCAMECMEAIERKDKETFRQAFKVLIADIIDKVSEPMEQE